MICRCFCGAIPGDDDDDDEDDDDDDDDEDDDDDNDDDEDDEDDDEDDDDDDDDEMTSLIMLTFMLLIPFVLELSRKLWKVRAPDERSSSDLRHHPKYDSFNIPHYVYSSSSPFTSYLTWPPNSTGLMTL